MGRREIAECHAAAGHRAEAVRSYLAAAAVLEKQDRMLRAIAVYTAVRHLDPENAEVAVRLSEVAADEARDPSQPEPELARSMTIRTRLRHYAPLFSEVTLTVDGAYGTPVVIETITDGGCFGEVSALSHAPRDVTATTAATTELLELSGDGLEAVAIAHPRIWQVLEAFQRSREIPAGV